MPILETTQLSRSFGDLLAVDSVSFGVDHGEVFGLLGLPQTGPVVTL